MSHDALLLLLRWLFALLAIAAVLVFVVRPLLHMLRRKPDMDFSVPDFSRLEGEELEIPTEKEEGEFDRSAAIQQARADPQATALLVQRWLKQKK
jgi:flagellar biosynthesis/type III secretory pathway M-ring protein FliF/YscJ